MRKVKQVILIRRDLNMRRGKEIAQGAHASMCFLVERVRAHLSSVADPIKESETRVSFSAEEKEWMMLGMAKICLQVHSEEELVRFHQEAIAAGITSHLIRDSGRTEFHGQPTLTACAIGPFEAEMIDRITGELQLY